MNLPQFCIKRPVFTIALMLILVIVGFTSFNRLPIREYPMLNKPVVSITTRFSGASASLMENNITTPIESAVASVNGIQAIRSQSGEGFSRINIEFRDNYDINVGVGDIRDRLGAVEARLPDGIDTPIVRKSDSDSRASLVLSVSDSQRNSQQLTDYLTRYVQPLFQQIEGVSDAQLWGERAYAMRVWLNPGKMAAQSIAVNDVISKVAEQNKNVPAGEIKGKTRYYPVIANTNLNSAQQFSDLILRDSNGKITRLGNVSNVKIGPEDIDNAFRINGHPGVALGIITDSSANPIVVSKNVQKVLKKLRANLPANMKIGVIFDSSEFINQSIHDVYRTLFEAVLLVVLVVFLFLGSIRSTWIPIVTIPLCLVTIFSALAAFQYSINTITLLAMVLAIGLVVDDAIVMLENIYRHIEQGKSPMQAALIGSKEIVFAIIAMTLTLVAVYLPIAFTQGLTGILFRQFALTLAGTVVISGFVALTLSPMMSARLLRPATKVGRFNAWLDKQLHRLTMFYQFILSATLKARWLVVVLLIVFAVIGGWVYKQMPSELAPKEDQGYIMGIISAPTNSSFKYTNSYAKKIEQIYASVPEARGYFMSVGGNAPASAFSILSLKPWGERTRSQDQIAASLRKQFMSIPGVNAFPVSPTPFRRHSSGNGAVELRIMSSASFDELRQLVNNLKEQLLEFPGITDVESSLQMDNQQFDIEINSSLAADLGVSFSDIQAAIATLLGGNTVTNFDYDGQSYDVILQMKRTDLKDFSGLDNVYLRSATNKMIPLTSLITIKSTVGPVNLPHYNRLRSDEISADVAPGYTVGQVVNYLQAFLKTHLPSDASYTFSGSVKDYLQANSRIQLIFLLALAFIYLVLAAQFESFIDPLIVLLSVPLTIVGGIVVLHLAGGTMNIFSQIGLVTLIGLIAKHGILITEFANQLRAQGKSKQQAIIEAASLRLRPILMTTGAMVLGALPLALASGAGAASRQQIGWVIVGGMSLGTFFSLFVVPVAYSFLSINPRK